MKRELPSSQTTTRSTRGTVARWTSSKGYGNSIFIRRTASPQKDKTNRGSTHTVIVSALTSLVVSACIALLGHYLSQSRDEDKLKTDNTLRLISTYNSPEMQEARLKVWVRRKEILTGASLAHVYDSMGSPNALCKDEKLFVQLLVITSFFREMHELQKAGVLDRHMLARHFRTIFGRWMSEVYKPGFRNLPETHWMNEVDDAFAELQRDMDAALQRR